MGREAVCTCDWAGTVTEVKALLETSELILRGDIRRRVPFSEIEDVKVKSDWLRFRVGGERVELLLGSSVGAKWAAAITSPPPSLARKLGITNKTVVRTIGATQDESLKAALAEAARISARDADLIVACVETPESLKAAFKEAAFGFRAGLDRVCKGARTCVERNGDSVVAARRRINGYEGGFCFERADGAAVQSA